MCGPGEINAGNSDKPVQVLLVQMELSCEMFEGRTAMFDDLLEVIFQVRFIFTTVEVIPQESSQSLGGYGIALFRRFFFARFSGMPRTMISSSTTMYRRLWTMRQLLKKISAPAFIY